MKSGMSLSKIWFRDSQIINTYYTYNFTKLTGGILILHPFFYPQIPEMYIFMLAFHDLFIITLLLFGFKSINISYKQKYLKCPRYIFKDLF